MSDTRDSGPVQTSAVTPRRGEVWFASLDPTLGREQAGRRPVLIVSTNGYNASRVGLVIALPLTSRVRPVQGRVLVRPPEGGLKVVSDILCPRIRV